MKSTSISTNNIETVAIQNKWSGFNVPTILLYIRRVNTINQHLTCRLIWVFSSHSCIRHSSSELVMRMNIGDSDCSYTITKFMHQTLTLFQPCNFHCLKIHPSLPTMKHWSFSLCRDTVRFKYFVFPWEWVNRRLLADQASGKSGEQEDGTVLSSLSGRNF